MNSEPEPLARMNCLLRRLCCSFMPGNNRSGRLMKACTLRWPVRYLPTRPERFATPFSAPDCAESSSKYALHTYPPATTNWRAWNSTGVFGSSRSIATAGEMRFVAGSSTSLRTIVRVTSRTRLAARSGCQVRSGEYFAPIGQIGVQVSLRQHCGRPLNGTDVFADGWLQVAIPAFVAHSLSNCRL